MVGLAWAMILADVAVCAIWLWEIAPPDRDDVFAVALWGSVIAGLFLAGVVAGIIWAQT